MLAVARDADAVLVTYARLTGDLLRQLRKCKAIGRFGLGVDNIDVAAARELGITVTYVPDYCMHEVSDHAMALILALCRKVAQSNALVQARRWEMGPLVPIHRLAGRVLGLVGFGNIPRTLAPKAKAFGLRVVAHDPYVSPQALVTAQVEGISLDRLLEISDIVSIHAPLTPATRGLINGEVLQKMKKGALLINTARGPLIDEAALVTGGGRGIGLAAGSALAQAGADVTLAARTRAEIEAAAQAIRARGDKAQALALDVTVEDFDLIMGLNARAAFVVAQAVARRLIEAKRPGSIINISSQMGHVGAARRTVYCASKHAMEGFTKAMAIELAPHNIRVNSLGPTFLETPMTRPFFENKAFRDEVLGKIKLGRLGRLDELTGAIIFLASDASSLMTGSALVLDGGWTAE